MLIFLTSPPSLLEDEDTWNWAKSIVQAHIDALQSRNHYNIKMSTALDTYGDASDLWSEVWSVMLPRLSFLIFFPDINGWIDATVYVEITESLAAGKKVYLLNKQGRIIPYQKITLHIHGNTLFFAKVTENAG